MQLSREIHRKIRSNVYYIQKHGLQLRLEYLGEERKNYLYHLIGLTSDAVFINPYDEELKRYVEILKKELKKIFNI